MEERNTKIKVIAAFDFDGTIIEGDTMFIVHKLLHNKISRVYNFIKLFPFSSNSCTINVYTLLQPPDTHKSNAIEL